MRDGVHSCRRGHAPGNRPCKVRIRDHIRRHNIVVNHNIFDHFFRVDQRAHIRDLTGSTCRGRNGDQRKARIFHHVHSAVFFNRSRVGHQHIHRFCKINAASASGCYKSVCFHLSGKSCRFFHNLIGGVWNYFVKHRICNA